jgi:hypothetical protein
LPLGNNHSMSCMAWNPRQKIQGKLVTCWLFLVFIHYVICIISTLDNCLVCMTVLSRLAGSFSKALLTSFALNWSGRGIVNHLWQGIARWSVVGLHWCQKCCSRHRCFKVLKMKRDISSGWTQSLACIFQWLKKQINALGPPDHY